MAATTRRILLFLAATATLLAGCSGSDASSSTPGSLASRPTVSAPAVASASTTASPSPNSAGAPPPEPTDTKFVLIGEVVASDGYTTTEHYRATWSEPDGVATKFEIYGVTDCLRSSAENDNTPCVIEGTALPASKLKLIVSAGGSERTIEVTWTLADEAGYGPYQAVVLFARNTHGSSSAAVLWSTPVCYGCVI